MALPCCCFVILNQCLFQLKFAEQKLNTQSLLGRINLVIFDTKNRKILTNIELGDVCQDTFGRFSRPAFANRFLHAARFLANCTAYKNQRKATHISHWKQPLCSHCAPRNTKVRMVPLPQKHTGGLEGIMHNDKVFKTSPVHILS